MKSVRSTIRRTGGNCGEEPRPAEEAGMEENRARLIQEGLPEEVTLGAKF